MAPRKSGGFRLTIRARITLSVALLITLGGGVIVAGLNLFMRYGPVWAIASAPSADLVASTTQMEWGPTQGDVYLGEQSGAAVPAIQIQDTSDVFGTLLWSSVVALLVIVVLGTFAAWVLAGRVLAPLHEINEAARAATPGRLDRRVALRGPRDELTDLSDTFDDMLERLERAFRAQQLFAANASHELRTPLATEKAMLDMLLDGPEPTPAEYRAVAERLREVNGRSIAMGEALLELTRAQISAGAGGGARIEAPQEASALLAEPLARWEPRAAERGIRIHAAVTPHRVPVNTELIGRLLDNVLGNAARHGTAGGTIELSWAAEGDSSVIRIANPAAPLDRETVARLHEPFVRGSGRVRAETGSGLGLAIAAAVAQAHGGTLRVLDPAGAGAGAGAIAGVGADAGAGVGAGAGTGVGAGFGTSPGSAVGSGSGSLFAVEVRLPLRATVDTALLGTAGVDTLTP